MQNTRKNPNSFFFYQIQNSTSYLIPVPNKCKTNGNAMQIRFESTSTVQTVNVMTIAILATLTCGHFIDTNRLDEIDKGDASSMQFV